MTTDPDREGFGPDDNLSDVEPDLTDDDLSARDDVSGLDDDMPDSDYELAPERAPYENLPDENVDPGADIDAQGVPDTYEDLQQDAGEAVADPMRRAAPGSQPVAATDFGMTEEEQFRGEPLTDRIEREEPEAWEDDENAPADTDRDRSAEYNAMRVDEP